MTNMIVPLLSIEQHSDNVNDVDDNVDDDDDNVDDTQMYNNSDILRYYTKQHVYYATSNVIHGHHCCKQGDEG